jgi:hypothetical protein
MKVSVYLLTFIQGWAILLSSLLETWWLWIASKEVHPFSGGFSGVDELVFSEHNHLGHCFSGGWAQGGGAGPLREFSPNGHVSYWICPAAYILFCSIYYLWISKLVPEDAADFHLIPVERCGSRSFWTSGTLFFIVQPPIVLWYSMIILAAINWVRGEDDQICKHTAMGKNTVSESRYICETF